MKARPDPRCAPEFPGAATDTALVQRWVRDRAGREPSTDALLRPGILAACDNCGLVFVWSRRRARSAGCPCCGLASDLLPWRVAR